MREQFPAVTVPVTPGMRDDIEPQAAPVGTVTRARNVRFPRAGGLQPRWGRTQLDSTTNAIVPYSAVLNTAQGPDFAHPCQGGFLFGAQGFGYRYDSVLGRMMAAGSYSTAQPRGKLDVVTREELTPIAGILTPWPLSTAVSGSLVATCHSVGNGQLAVGATVVGTQQDGAQLGATATAVVRVFSQDGGLVGSFHFSDAQSAMIIDDALGTLKMVYQNGTDLRVRDFLANGQPAASASIGTLATATSFFAACRWPGIGWAVIWQSAPLALTVQKMSGMALVDTAPPINFAAAAGVPVSIYANATHLYTGWTLRSGGSWDALGRVTDTAFGGISTYLVRSLGAAQPYLGPPLYGPSRIATSVIALVALAATARPDIGNCDTQAFRVTSAGVVSVGNVNHTVLPLSAPFANGLWWARHATRMPGGIQTMRAVLLDFQEARGTGSVDLLYPKIALVGDQFTFGKNTTTPANVYRQHLHAPVQLNSGDWVMGIPRVVRHELDVPGTSTYLPICEWLRFATGCEQQVRTVGEDALVGGSLTSVSAGLGTFVFGTALPSTGLDIGMLQMPSIAQLVGSVGAGALTLLGTYQYRAVIELIDAAGRRWRSAPSTVVPLTLVGAENTITITLNAWLPLLRAFSLQATTGRILVHIYRSPANGFNFQRVTPAMGAPAVHTSGTFNFVDTLDDSVIAPRESLYTDGGVLQNDHPPSCRFIADTEDRVWLGGLWDPNLIQSSKTIVPGEGLAFSDLDAFKVDLKEPCTGLAAQDGILFAFTATRVYSIQGLGPNAQGQGAWDDAKREISRSTGCIDWRSIVETTNGIVYQSKRGIMLVPRGGGEPQFIGGPVQKLLAELGGVITGASVCQDIDGHTARFCCAGGTLILDLVTLAWSYDVQPGAVHSKVCDTAEGPALARKVTFFDRETRGQTLDGAAQIESFVSWAPVRPGGLAGWGTFVSAIGVFGKLDGLPYPATPLTFSVVIDNDTTGTATRPTMVDFQPIVDFRRIALRNRQGCSAALSFQTAGAPWRFVGWTVETQDLDGPRRTPPSEYL